MFKMNKKKLIIIISVVLIISAFIVRNVQKKGTQVTAEPNKTIPTVKVDRGDIDRTSTLKGNFSSMNRVDMTGFKGKVKDVFVNKGDLVKKGDVIFTLDNTDSNLELQRLELENETKQLEYQKALKAMSSDKIYSASGGKLSKLYIKDGDKVERNGVIAELSNTGVLELVADIDAESAKKLKINDEAELFVLKYFSKLKGSVTGISSQTKKSASGGAVAEVKIRIVNPGTLASGDEIQVSIPIGDSLVRGVGVSKVREVETIKVVSGSSGMIKSLKVSEGDTISENSLIAELNLEDSISALKSLELSLKQTALSLETAKKDNKNGAYADIDGIVGDLNVSIGKDVPTDKPAVSIIGNDDMEFKVTMDEEDIPYMKLGQEVKIKALVFPDKFFNGVISYIASSGKAEGTSVAFDVCAKITDSGELKAGMSGEAEIILEKKSNVLRVPVSVVKVDGNKGTVTFFENGAYNPKDVSIGLIGDEFIEVKEGLNEGDEVSISPYMNKTVKAVG